MLQPIRRISFTVVIFALTACGARNGAAPGSTPILLFNGTGVSFNDVAAIETILKNSHLEYSKVSSPQLNEMGPSQLGVYRLLIIPGGNFIRMGNGLEKITSTNVRLAVSSGLNYLGICAGGFLAGKSDYYNGFDLTSGITFPFYSAENRGIRKAAVTITDAKGQTLDQYWEDGPQLSGWGEVVAKYPDGVPAVTEGKCGTGTVILSGIHAEAPESWRRGMVFHTPVAADMAYAALLIRAALNGTSLPHY